MKEKGGTEDLTLVPPFLKYWLTEIIFHRLIGLEII